MQLELQPIFLPYHHTFAKLRRYWQTFQELKIEPNLRTSLGLSDANFLNAQGILAVLIGTEVRKAHTVLESLPFNELKNLTKFLITTIKS